MEEQNAARAYISTVIPRVGEQGFDCTQDVAYGDETFLCVARRARFELGKFGFAETFFVFGEFSSVDTRALTEFSGKCFKYALSAKRVPLPRGLFESVFCYSVALVDRVDDAVASAVRSQAPARHWASAEIPVVYETESGALHYFEKTPVWGGAYYAGFRKTIQELLAT